MDLLFDLAVPFVGNYPPDIHTCGQWYPHKDIYCDIV